MSNDWGATPEQLVTTTTTIFGNVTDAKSVSTRPVEYQLVKRGVEYVLQGKYAWVQGSCGGFEWRDMPTVVEEEK